MAVLGSFAMILAAPPANLWALGLIVWVPLAVISGSERPRRAALFGWIQGAVAQGGVLFGLPAALRHAGGASYAWSVLLASLLATFEGARFGAVALVAARARGNGWPLVATFPLALVSVELVFPMFFPWTASLFFHGAPVLLQGAELGGVAALSLWVGVLNASLATAWLERASARARLRFGLLIPGFTLAAVASWGALRIHGIDTTIRQAPDARVAIVQGNVTGPEEDAARIYRTESLGVLAREKVELLVWPETALPRPVSAPWLSSFFSRQVLRDTTASGPSPVIGAPLLTGVVIQRSTSESAPANIHRLSADGTWQRDPEQRFNSAALVLPDGQIAGTYDKRELVALGEYLPYEASLPWLRRLLPAAGTFAAGQSLAPLVLNGKRILVVICYEDLMAEQVRRAVDDEAPDLLVNLTSDSWFGASRVPDLHAALAKLRAIEHRRYFVRATNTGDTAVFDPAGRTVIELPPRTRASTVATVHWMRSRTLFESLGSAPAYLIAAAMVLMLLRRMPATKADARA
jgi:apolipoprotein N-acyltransferase